MIQRVLVRKWRPYSIEQSGAARGMKKNCVGCWSSLLSLASSTHSLRDWADSSRGRCFFSPFIVLLSLFLSLSPPPPPPNLPSQLFTSQTTSSIIGASRAEPRLPRPSPSSNFMEISFPESPPRVLDPFEPGPAELKDFLWFAQGQGVIKPIACRPVVSSSANSTPILGNRPAAPLQQQPLPLKSQSAGGGRPSSFGLHSSTSDLRPVRTALQRFSWSKGEESAPGTPTLAAPLKLQPRQPPQAQRKLEFRASELTAPSSQPPPPPSHNNHHHHHQPPTPAKSASPATPASAANLVASSAATGRVADLSRRFGGSLCSVAAPPNSPTPHLQHHHHQPQTHRQPPAYRPPPARMSGKNGVDSLASHWSRNFLDAHFLHREALVASSRWFFSPLCVCVFSFCPLKFKWSHAAGFSSSAWPAAGLDLKYISYHLILINE